MSKFTISRNFIRLPEKLVEVIRYYPEDRVKDHELIKEWLNVDTVLRNGGYMYFCQTIEEAVEIDDQVEVPKRGRPKKIT